MFTYVMKFNNSAPPRRIPGTKAILSNAAGQQVGTFGDVVELLQCLPGHDPDYACIGDWFRINTTGRTYSIGLELEEILGAVRDDGRWQIVERHIGDY